MHVDICDIFMNCDGYCEGKGQGAVSIRRVGRSGSRLQIQGGPV